MTDETYREPAFTITERSLVATFYTRSYIMASAYTINGPTAADEFVRQREVRRLRDYEMEKRAALSLYFGLPRYPVLARDDFDEDAIVVPSRYRTPPPRSKQRSRDGYKHEYVQQKRNDNRTFKHKQNRR